MIDHKIIGKNLKLFIFDNYVGKGLPIWLPNGLYIYNKIKKIIKLLNIKDKYKEVLTPNIVNKNLYKLSGHLNKYHNNIYKIKKKKFFIKPMNCPTHCIIYKNNNNLYYKKLPIKYFEFGTVYRNEKSGQLNGLFRTISFTQDDGHIFCLKKNIYKEIIKLIKNIINIYNKFNLKKIYIRLSLRDKKKIKFNKYIGNRKNWEKIENIMFNIQKIIKKKYNYKIYIKYGEAAFYGPKIDFIVKDSLLRKWQLGTIQIDNNSCKNFNIKYIDKYNNFKYPILLHRAYLGSIERFIAILIEHNNGILPIWLLKLQLIILPINKNNLLYSIKIFNKLKKKKINVKLNKKKINLNKKIKKYIKRRVPIIFIIGDKEVKNNSIFIRTYDRSKIGNFKFKYAINYVLNKIKIKF
ncbi:MAG: threonine--tRNA ligase [Candidatus Shikimatogenerans sp. JK-2022]|nr:threonine--tRNA ligase [Candidatus Shikimatogenerans bostrichidophilus]